MLTEKHNFRIDLNMEKVRIDPKTGVFEAELVFDPDRYELKTINGQEGYLDKFDKIFFPMREINETLARQLKGLPIYYSKPDIKSIKEYVNARISELSIAESEDKRFEYKDVSEEFLERSGQKKKKFVIISIDLKGSTNMSQDIGNEEYSKLIALFLREMTLIVSTFEGYVLKNTGDGLVAYFPEPNFLGMNDNAVYCAVTMKEMILYGLNPFLEKKDMPALKFRIGLDSGEAVVTTLGVESIKMQKDIIGETINIAAKIQSCAEENQILLGESTAQNVHNFWRKEIERIKMPDNWTYKDKKTGRVYALFRLGLRSKPKRSPIPTLTDAASLPN